MLNNNAIIIEGINKVIEGLTDIKCGLMSTTVTVPQANVVSEGVKELIEEVSNKVNDTVHTEKVGEVKNNGLQEAKQEDNKEEEEIEVEETTSREDELTALHINKLRSLAKEYGLSAGGSKVSLIEAILAHEASLGEDEEEVEEEEYLEIEDAEEAPEESVVEEVEEEDEVEEDEESENFEFTDEDVEEYKAFLEEEFELVGLKEIANLMELKVPAKITKKALIEKLISDMPSLHEALDEMGCFQDIDEDEEDEEDIEEVDSVEEIEEDEVDEDEDEEDSEFDYDIAEELGLRDMTQEELADILAEHGLSTKGLKTALIDRIVLAVKNGIIEVEDDAPKLLSKKELEALKKKIFNLETEAFETKKLKSQDIQKFLKKYYVDEKKYHNYRQMGLTNQDALGLYIKAKQSLLDDYGTRRDLMDAYLKDGVFHCCGRKLIDQDETTAFCPNCHSSYEVKR